MKTKWFFLLLALAVSMGLLFACGDDDDDDNAGDDDDNDDNNDTDDDDDDDTTSGNLDVGGLTQSACLDGADGSKDEPWDPEEDPIDVVLVSWNNGVLTIEDKFAYVNCGFELAVEANLEGGVVTVKEIGNGTVADCVCPFDLAYEITGITGDQITLRIERQDVGTTSTYSIFELPDLSLNAGNRQWYVPFVEVFLAGDPGTQPFQVRYGACNMYHQEDQVFMVRQEGTLFHVFSYDWFDLDDPGEYDPNCQIPVWIEVGNLAAGSYHFGAPSYEIDSETWSMLNFEVEI
jgi:hypothetical protein